MNGQAQERREGRTQKIQAGGVVVAIIISSVLAFKKNPSPIGLADDLPDFVRMTLVGAMVIAAIVFLVACRGAQGIALLMDCAEGAAVRSTTFFHSLNRREAGFLEEATLLGSEALATDATPFHASYRPANPLLGADTMLLHATRRESIHSEGLQLPNV